VRFSLFPMRTRSLGIWVEASDSATIIEKALALAEAGAGGVIVAANLNYAQLVSDHAELRRQNEGDALTIADGMSLVVASRFSPRPIPQRTTGSDLVAGILARARDRGLSALVAGRNRPSLETATAFLTTKYPGLRLTAPPLTAEPLSEGWTRALLAEIATQRPSFVFLAGGQPQGDQWIEAHRAEAGNAILIQVGAAFDYLSGHQKRVPPFWGEMGLEWAYRLAHHPRRLGPRYLRNAWFLCRTLIRPTYQLVSP